MLQPGVSRFSPCKELCKCQYDGGLDDFWLGKKSWTNLKNAEQYRRAQCFRRFPLRRVAQGPLQVVQRLSVQRPAIGNQVIVLHLLSNKMHGKRAERAIENGIRADRPKPNPAKVAARIPLFNGSTCRLHHGRDKLASVWDWF